MTNRRVIYILLAALLAVGGPKVAGAQVDGTAWRAGERGEGAPTPYVAFSTLQSATFHGSANEDVPRAFVVDTLLAVSSIDTVTRLVGEPTSMTHESPFGRDVLAYLIYDGLRLEFVKYEKDKPQSKYELRELQITSSEWMLRLNGTDLHPGMSVDRLSPVVQKIIRSEANTSARAGASFVVAKPGTAERLENGGNLEVARGGARIHLWVNDGTVDKVRFYREL